MAIPHIMPLGFIHRRTEAGAIIMLADPLDSRDLRLETPVTLWRYSPGRLAAAKVRGTVSRVGYVTATFEIVESWIDPRSDRRERTHLQPGNRYTWRCRVPSSQTHIRWERMRRYKPIWRRPTDRDMAQPRTCRKVMSRSKTYPGAPTTHQDRSTRTKTP